MNHELFALAVQRARFSRDLPATAISSQSDSKIEALVKRISDLEARIAKLEGPREPAGHINSHKIVKVVCIAYGIVNEELINCLGIGATRPRQICAYLMKKYTALSWNQIGRRLGGRDHSTMAHATRRITHLREIDQKFDAKMANLEASLRA